MFIEFSCGYIIGLMNSVTEVQMNSSKWHIVRSIQWLIIISRNGNRSEMKIWSNQVNCFFFRNVSTAMATFGYSCKNKTIEPQFCSWTNLYVGRLFFGHSKILFYPHGVRCISSNHLKMCAIKTVWKCFMHVVSCEKKKFHRKIFRSNVPISIVPHSNV